MIPGIMAAQMRVASGAALWTPLNMATVPQIYLDAQDSTVTDVSGFASAISNLGAMGSDGDFSQATAGSRPAILAAELNGNRVLSFDGVDDAMSGGTAAQKDLFRNKAAAFAFFVYKKRTEDTSGGSRTLFFSSTGASTFINRFTAFAGITTIFNRPGIGARRLDGDTSATMSHGTAAFGSYAMTLSSLDYSTRRGKIYINGNAPTENATLTASAGSTSDTASQADLF
jgi:hypothetical protein